MPSTWGLRATWGFEWVNLWPDSIHAWLDLITSMFLAPWMVEVKENLDEEKMGCPNPNLFQLGLKTQIIYIKRSSITLNVFLNLSNEFLFKLNCEDLCRRIFSHISIICWEDLVYLYRSEKSKITFRLVFLSEVLNCYKWYQNELDP